MDNNILFKIKISLMKKETKKNTIFSNNDYL